MDEQIATISIDIQELSSSTNINELLTEEQSNAVGRTCKDGYVQDRMSRYEWERQNRECYKQALQITEDKSFPWAGASNVKHPMITIATLQWASRAYASLIQPPNVVRCRVTGDDQDGQKASRAARVSEHMNFQLIEQDEAWEEEHDKMLMTMPITGCSFIKTTRHPTENYPIGQHVLPQDLVLDYYAKSVESCNRKTHRFNFWPRQIREKQLTGEYTDQDLGSRANEPDFYDSSQSIADERQGISKTTEDGPRLTLEQHCYFDFDGDGYEEPYIVTFDFASGKVHKIQNRFRTVVTEQSLQAKRLQDGLHNNQNVQQVEKIQKALVKLREEKPKVVRIDAAESFTKYSFIPAPDGGIYDLGFGTLLGPLNRAVDTLINELIDAGKLQNQSSGFIGKGAKIKGGRLRFDFGEWKKVDVAGATLKESIVPLPVNAPSPVLFQLLGMMIQYGEKTASVTDAMTGENPGQNTPAYNMNQMLTQGMAVYGGIFKRVYRGMRAEFRLRYKINALYVSPVEYFQVIDGQPKQVERTDYQGDPKDIRPVADPNVVINEEKIRRLMTVAERARLVPGYNTPRVERMLLETLQVEDVDQIFPVDEKGQPAIKPPPDPQFQLEAMKEQRAALESDGKAAKDKAEMQMKAAETEAKIELVQAQTVKAYAEAGAVDRKLLNEQAKEANNRLNIQRQAAKDAGELYVKQEDQKLAKRNGSGGAGMAAQSGNAGGTGDAETAS